LYVQRFLDKYPQIDVGLLFLGTCGVGKTHLAVSLLRHVITDKGDAGLFYNYDDLLRAIRASWNPVSLSSELDVLKPVAEPRYSRVRPGRRTLEAPVLVLEELGASKTTEWVRDTMSYIIKCRYNDKKITLQLSGLSPQSGRGIR
jgi:DNA replication protein DnaC